MKKITVTFRCDCGYIRTADVINLKFAGQLINDIIQFGMIYKMAKVHAREIHSKNLDFSLISFVLNQRAQRKAKKIQIEKLKKDFAEKNSENTSPELLELIKKIQYSAEQRNRYEQWKVYLDNSKAG